MNVSSDSQIDFILNIDDSMAAATPELNVDVAADETAGDPENPTPMHDGGVPPTTGDAGTGSATAGPAMATALRDGVPTAVLHHVAMGVAAGDGDLMPPRFAGDRRSNAGEWVRDFRDYIKIRNIPAETAKILLRNHLTDVARQWFERLSPDLQLEEIQSRFQTRFGDTDAMQDRLTTDFWGRRQRADEPAEIFIEGMASLACRIRLDNPHFLRQAIINGLRPDLQMAVKLQRPTTLEEIAAAAAIAEAGPVTVAQPTRTDDAESMRSLVAAIKELVASQACPTATAATPNTATATPTPAATPCYVVMQGPPPHDGGHGVSGRGRGRGRGWRGPGRGQPTPPHSAVQQRQLDPAAPAYQPATSAPTRQPVTNDQPDAATCLRCGRFHYEGRCLDAVP